MDDLSVKASSQVSLEKRLALLPLFQIWVKCEFFYSPDDCSFFSENGMELILRELGFPPGTKLTPKKWSCIKSLLGKPRRLSERFLEEVTSLMK
jgi:DIRP